MDREKYIYHASNNEKKGVAIFISNKADFKVRKIIRDKKNTLHNTKSILLEDITILNMYAPK